MDKHRIVIDPKTRTVRRTDGSLYSIRTIGGSPKKHKRNEYDYDGDYSSPVLDPNFTDANIVDYEYNSRDSIGKLSYNSKKRYGYDGFYNANHEPVHKVYNKKYRRAAHDALYSIVLKDDYLAHHGIKGQKWGVRRYQNPDGSLTEEGKKRAHRDEYEKENPTLRGLRTASTNLKRASIATGVAGAAAVGASVAGIILSGGTASIPIGLLYAAGGNLIGESVATGLARIPLNSIRNTKMKNRGIKDYKPNKEIKRNEKLARYVKENYYKDSNATASDIALDPSHYVWDAAEDYGGGSDKKLKRMSKKSGIKV